MNEYKINYHLQKVVKKNDTYHYILLSVAWNNKRVRTTLKIEIDEKLWDKQKQRAKASSKNPRQINDKLDKIRVQLTQYYEDIEREFNREPSLNETKDAVQAVINNKPIKNKKINDAKKNANFLKAFENFIKDTEKGIRLGLNGKKVQEQSIAVYYSCLNHLRELIQDLKINPTIEELDDRFYSSLIEYLTKKKLSNNYQSRIIKTIKVMMNYTLGLGLHSNIKFMKALKIYGTSSVKIALDIDEIKAIESLENLNPRLEKVRTMFLIQLFSGLRFSDLINLGKANIDYKSKLITLFAVKTQEPVNIPITNRLEVLLKKYVGTKAISSQKYNDYLKELCKQAKIDKPIVTTYFIGNKRIDKTMLKYSLVSSHTSRRSYITNSLLKGVIEEKVMQITGHTDKKSFQNYIKIDNKVATDEMREVWE